MSKNKIFHFGNVGINQNNPTFMLDVNGETRINNNLVIGSGDKIYTKNSQGQLTIMGGATYPGSAIKFAGGQSGATDQGQMIFYAGTSTSLQEKLRIKSNGYVGINEDEPQARLDVKASGGLGSIFRRDYQGASNTTAASSKLALTIWGQDHDDSAYGSGTEMYGPMIGFGGRVDDAVPNTGDIRAAISYKYNGALTFHTKAGSPGVANGAYEKLRIYATQGVKMVTNNTIKMSNNSDQSAVGYGERTRIFPYWVSDTGACRFNVTFYPTSGVSTPRFWIFTNATNYLTGTIEIGANSRTNSPNSGQQRFHHSKWNVGMYGEGDNDFSSSRWRDSQMTQRGNTIDTSGGVYYVHTSHSEYNTNANQYQNGYGGWFWHLDNGTYWQAQPLWFDMYFSNGGGDSHVWYAYIDD